MEFQNSLCTSEIKNLFCLYSFSLLFLKRLPWHGFPTKIIVEIGTKVFFFFFIFTIYIIEIWCIRYFSEEKKCCFFIKLCWWFIPTNYLHKLGNFVFNVASISLTSLLLVRKYLYHQHSNKHYWLIWPEESCFCETDIIKDLI